MTIPEAIEAMKRNLGQPDEALCMAAFADVWEEAEGMVGCEYGFGPLPGDHSECSRCHGSGYVSNGNSARAEYLRILAECGKVGDTSGEFVANYAYWSISDRPHEMRVPDSIWNAAAEMVGGEGLYGLSVISNRLALMDAYAAADQPTRERWARETRALVPGATCERCEGRGHLDLYSCPSCYLSGTPGRVAAPQEATR
jgi:hypothetical protein